MNKLKSRKFFVFISWCLLMIGVILKHPDDIANALPYFGGVSMIYIGFQAIVDFIPAIISVIETLRKGESCGEN